MSSKVISDEFLPWLDEILRERGWTDYRLSKEAGISHSVLSRARAGQSIGWDSAASIAMALSVRPEIVMAKIGLLPPPQDGRSISTDEIISLFSTLSNEDQEEILQIARLKVERKKRGGNRGKMSGG